MAMSDKDESHVSRCTPGQKADAPNEAAASALREEHLAGWRVMAARNKTGKQALGRHVRLFRLQHFWRALHERHGAACRGRKDSLMHAFAGFFSVKHDTIRGDLRLITRRLGTGWYAGAKSASAASPV